MSPPTDDEVQQLRERVHVLEADLEKERRARHAAELARDSAADGAVPVPGSATEQGRARHGRSVVSFVALLLACLLAPLSVVSVWASTQISDTDQYVRTVAPLADDPGVQAAVAAEVTDAVLSRIDVEGVTQELLESLAAQPNVPPRVAQALPGLALPITNGVESFTRDQVENLLASDEFATLWVQVNRAAHAQVVRLLEGDPEGVVTAQDDTVTLNLAPIIAQVKQDLVDRGFTLAENVPEVDRSFVLAQSDTVTQAQGVYRLLQAMGAWLPVVALALLTLGVLLAGDRRRALLRGALGVVGAVLLLGIALAVFRASYVESTPAGVLTPETAGEVFDTLVRFLRTGLRAVAVFGLILALVAFLSGPSSAARSTRATLTRGIGSARDSAETAGLRTGRLGAWLYAHKAGLRVTILVIAGLVLLFWTRPTGWVVVGVAVGGAAGDRHRLVPGPAALSSLRRPRRVRTGVRAGVGGRAPRATKPGHDVGTKVPNARDAPLLGFPRR